MRVDYPKEAGPSITGRTQNKALPLWLVLTKKLHILKKIWWDRARVPPAPSRWGARREWGEDGRRRSAGKEELKPKVRHPAPSLRRAELGAAGKDLSWKILGREPFPCGTWEACTVLVSFHTTPAWGPALKPSRKCPRWQYQAGTSSGEPPRATLRLKGPVCGQKRPRSWGRN